MQTPALKLPFPETQSLNFLQPVNCDTSENFHENEIMTLKRHAHS
jgi:hypothetical protein